MKYLGFLLVIMTAWSGIAHADQSYIEEVESWHERRGDRLTAPDGYLSLVGLHWLNEKPRTITGIGTAWVANDTVTVQLEPGFQFEGEGAESVTLDLSRPEGKEKVRRDTLHFYPIKRGNQVALRVKDTEAETRVTFEGIERFPVDSKWRVRGRLIPHSENVSIDSVVGVSTEEESPGYAAFELGGESHRALLIGEPDDQTLFLVFSDQTAGNTTYPACRFLYVERQGEEGLILDFNKAINPACAFTQFATCPLPPKENMFSVPIPAGEKAP